MAYVQEMFPNERPVVTDGLFLILVQQYFSMALHTLEYWQPFSLETHIENAR
ncbi:MAG: hypothetical protein GY822_16325 [Deltaproteobacteria bacterium]|nr:hypothetical protein [Deltaproteobacteria bacterium]